MNINEIEKTKRHFKNNGPQPKGNEDKGNK